LIIGCRLESWQVEGFQLVTFNLQLSISWSYQ